METRKGLAVKLEGLKLKKGVLVYSGTPMMGRSVIRSSAVGLFDVGNPQKYVEKMKAVIQEKKLDWSFKLDETESDLEELLKEQTDLIVLLPGLERKFSHGNFPVEKYIQLNSLDFHSYNLAPVLAFMEK